VIDVLVVLLLAVGIAVVVLSCAGILVSEDVFDKLHYVTPASTIAPLCFAAAIVLEEGFAVAGIKALAVAALLLITSPVLSHATARAARVRQFGHWRALAGEKLDER
jgi:multicomponent Na+:H+ antiporter subunit G